MCTPSKRDVVTALDEPRFSLDSLVPADGSAVVTVAGELDMFRAPAFQAMLRRCIEQGARHVVVDLDEVTFIDSTGISVIVGAVARLRTAEGSLTIVYSSANVGRVFEIAAIDRIVGVYECRPHSLAVRGQRES